MRRDLPRVLSAWASRYSKQRSQELADIAAARLDAGRAKREQRQQQLRALSVAMLEFLVRDETMINDQLPKHRVETGAFRVGISRWFGLGAHACFCRTPEKGLLGLDPAVSPKRGRNATSSIMKIVP